MVLFVLVHNKQTCCYFKRALLINFYLAWSVLVERARAHHNFLIQMQLRTNWSGVSEGTRKCISIGLVPIQVYGMFGTDIFSASRGYLKSWSFWLPCVVYMKKQSRNFKIINKHVVVLLGHLTCIPWRGTNGLLRVGEAEAAVSTYPDPFFWTGL